MSEPRYVIHETYPGGHEMRHNWYGPATEAEFRAGTPVQDEHSRREGESFQTVMDMWAKEPGFPTLEDQLNLLFQEGELYGTSGDYYTLEPHKEWVLVVTWSEPEDGIAVYGPYHTREAVEADIPRVEPQFVNPFASQQELDAALADSDPDQIRTAEQCGDMGFEFGGCLPDDVIFHTKQLNAD